jgi:hypothetical protein
MKLQVELNWKLDGKLDGTSGILGIVEFKLSVGLAANCKTAKTR